METKEYKRIPVLPSTKQRFGIEKIKSDYETQDEFLNYLLDVCEALNSGRYILVEKDGEN